MYKFCILPSGTKKVAGTADFFLQSWKLVSGWFVIKGAILSSFEIVTHDGVALLVLKDSLK